MMGRHYDSGSETRPSSSGSDSSRGGKRRRAPETSSSSGMHAHFADGGVPGAAPEGGGKDKEFAAKRKAHYSREFDRARAVDIKQLLAKRAAIVTDDDEDSDVDEVKDSFAAAWPARPTATITSASSTSPFASSMTRSAAVGAPGATPFGGAASGFVRRPLSGSNSNEMQLD